jgi:hypothetical protein
MDTNSPSEPICSGCSGRAGFTKDWHAPEGVDRWVCAACLRPTLATALRLGES